MDDGGFDEFDEFDEEPEGGEEDLMHIFEYYASYGEPLPAAELHASKVSIDFVCWQSAQMELTRASAVLQARARLSDPGQPNHVPRHRPDLHALHTQLHEAVRSCFTRFSGAVR